MEEFFTRTSVSIDEAVGILVGWLRGPFDGEFFVDENKNETESSVFDLTETLGDEGEFLESEYAEAHHDQSPPEVIAQKLEALKSHGTRCDKAKKYLCDIEDELNKGEASALRIAKECPYAMRHITLSSLNEWSTEKYSIDIFSPDRSPVSIQEAQAKEKEKSGAKGVGTKNNSAPGNLRLQEDAILDAIKQLGFDPKSLPKHSYTKPGIKSYVHKHLINDELFSGTTVFGKAWERLRKSGDITDKK